MKNAWSTGAPPLAMHAEAFIVAETLSAKDPPADPLIGYKLDGRYTLERLIGEGGTGRVYQARQEATGREVAVKLLRDELLRDEASVRRFEREARAACRINHPNAIIVHDFGRSPEGHCYLVTELIEGQTLREHLDRAGLLPPERALALFFQILAGVAAAHERGVVHRDLHPGNIFLCRGEHGEERVKVFDFGGARLLDTQQDTDVTGVGHLDLRQLLHSIRYLPPERLQRDRPPDTRGDVYALGLILFELCTGKYPFVAQDPLQVMAKHLREPPPLLVTWAPGRIFSPSLQGLVASMMAKDPLQRPKDAGDVARRLSSALERDALITVEDTELVPEPEVEMEMEAMPAAYGDGDGDDVETRPFPLLSEAVAPRTRSAASASAASPPARVRLVEDTVMELSPPGIAPVRAVAPEPPSMPSIPIPLSQPGAARRGRTLAFALLCLLGGAGLVFASGAAVYQLYLRRGAQPAPGLAQPTSAPSTPPGGEPPPAPLAP